MFLKVECTFLVFGKLGSGVRNGELDYSGIHELQNLCFVNQKDIEISLEQSTTNEVTQFSQKYNITRTPIYDLREKQVRIIMLLQKLLRTTL